VEFCFCELITDVPGFQHAEIVNFQQCQNVTNVNSLAGVKELVLKDCRGPTDVSELGRVKKLEISNCENLHDLTALYSSYSQCFSVPGTSSFSIKPKYCLGISFFDLDFSSIEFLAGNKTLRELDISSNMNIRNISMLNAVVVLNIRSCSLVTSLVGLTALRELNMVGVEKIETGFGFSSLRNSLLEK
jgi:hypothetical protein